MRIVHRAVELESTHRCVLVPTMGALHDGHAALVRQARAESERQAGKPGIVGAAVGKEGSRPPVVVTIFVNPTQFDQRADLDRYPRTLEADCKICERAGADVVFAPAVEEVYPPGNSLRVPRLPEVATEPGLEDAARPGHFAGVCQVVLRLFELTRPGAAIFGEKDWQQLQVVRAMVAQERLSIEIIPGPTVRESDGLAMSSRNRFLSPQERAAGLSLSRALREAHAIDRVADAEARLRAALDSAGVQVDYAVVREAESLRRVGTGHRGSYRAIVAGRVGTVRLLDNAPWPGRGG
ncbi:MAG: pantoate--beta-alanine ligase [Phycisphaerales bacterium]|nr:pantoate--beta-alanine ligase [Phycisphaerales bacterium]